MKHRTSRPASTRPDKHRQPSVVRRLTLAFILTGRTR